MAAIHSCRKFISGKKKHKKQFSHLDQFDGLSGNKLFLDYHRKRRDWRMKNNPFPISWVENLRTNSNYEFLLKALVIFPSLFIALARNWGKWKRRKLDCNWTKCCFSNVRLKIKRLWASATLEVPSEYDGGVRTRDPNQPTKVTHPNNGRKQKEKLQLWNFWPKTGHSHLFNALKLSHRSFWCCHGADKDTSSARLVHEFAVIGNFGLWPALRRETCNSILDDWPVCCVKTISRWSRRPSY